MVDEAPRRLTPAELHIALALAEGPAHGYLLMHRVEQIGRGDTAIGAATMYRTLRRLLDDGLVEQTGATEHDERRRPYRLTRHGIDALGAEGRRLAALVGAAVARGVPERFHSITVQLTTSDARAAIAFYSKAFEARELTRKLAPDGRIMHTELNIGDSLLLLHDNFDTADDVAHSAAAVTIHLYVSDADATFARAVDAGAHVLLPIDNQSWGDRYGIVKDPFGHRWSIGTRTP